MITETGQVITVADGKAMIEIVRGAACDTCKTDCPLKSGQQCLLIEARDPIGVHKHDTVQIGVPVASALRASFAVYMIPLFALIGGALLGEYAGSIFGEAQTALATLLSFGFLGLSLILIRLYNNRVTRNRHNQPVITKVL